ncbi:tRNA methyltransferase complex GCD14 subunit-domain-containing protein [Absidia repens]|uniref:tRNA (adenine(58)-N(1))-methyltransferase catalytic subunit TRM61 n=1 Tax=Absidia repens TaxID=90262 RepID=A0A1X2I7I0_9FUNG|nr:tRNA methyltransferase complex GCD14 subunit-domain-containing protein [Absidia repens]
MSFSGWKKYIGDGDLVIFYINRDNLSPVWIKSGKSSTNRFGLFEHDNLIGKEFGSRVISSNYKGFIYLLHPTPELWTLVVPHRTQILYLPDISFITTYLDMKPGSHVLECGTGSGSFSHSIARTIAPTGKLFSFEYHSQRAELAAEEFRSHGLGDLIELKHRDVCRDGFGLKDTVNAVFLDLPAPWEAIGYAKEAFKQHQTGKICTFSPCIEQVSRSVASLNDHGFVDITMYECLIRNHDVSFIQKVAFKDAIQQAKEKKENVTLGKRKSDVILDLDDTVEKMLVSKTNVEARGHTSYLTFATFLPAFEENKIDTSANITASLVDSIIEEAAL